MSRVNTSKSFSERYNIEFEPLDYAPDNVIVEVLEEDEDNVNDIRTYRNFDIDFDESGFSIWADL